MAYGNSYKPKGGYKPDKIVTDALRQELAMVAEDAAGKPITDNNGKPMRKLRLLARKLVDKALEGDTTAAGMIVDRMEGKARQVSDVNVQQVSFVQLHIEALRELAGRFDGQAIEHQPIQTIEHVEDVDW